MKKIQNITSFKSRKMIANGIFISKLIYLMPLWSGCDEYLVKGLQVIQNKAARSVAKVSFFTPIKTLLKTCGWLSVRQLMAYHSLVLLYKTLSNKVPQYLYEKVSAGGQSPYKTRQFSFSVQHPTENGAIRQAGGQRLTKYKEGWCWRSVELFNTLPRNLRLETKTENFKRSLKKWVEMNIDI